MSRALGIILVLIALLLSPASLGGVA